MMLSRVWVKASCPGRLIGEGLSSSLFDGVLTFFEQRNLICFFQRPGQQPLAFDTALSRHFMLTASAFEQLLHVDPVEEVDDLADSGASQAVDEDRSTRVLDEVRSRLNCEARLMSRRINVSLQEGQVVLTGSVRTWFEKQLAQRLAM